MSSKMRNHFHNSLGINHVPNLGKYLGLPSLFSANKSKDMQFIVDKVGKVIQIWKAKFFSSAGKEILIKNIGQAIPVHLMSCFKLPKKILKNINRILANFWWGSSSNFRKIHWASWENLCFPKCKGGLNFKDFEVYNQSLPA